MLVLMPMARKIIPLVTGEKYHLFNRGVDKRTVFEDKTDFLRFYQTLSLFNTEDPIVNYSSALVQRCDTSKKLVQIESYCLLPNHFHLLVTQLIDGGISEFMKRVSVGHTGYFNEKYERSGSLFQGVFKRVLVDSDQQYNYLFAYINENYFVHDIKPLPSEIIYTSSLYYQGIMRSKLLPEKVGGYDLAANRSLACGIFDRRKTLKSILFES